MAKYEHMDDKEIRKYLSAFADGELDVEQNLRVLEQMAMNPNATRRVMHQQQLRQLVDRALREMTPSLDSKSETENSLRHRIEKLAEELPSAIAEQVGQDDSASSSQESQNGQHTPGVLSYLGPWLPAIAASILLVASVTFWIMGQQANVTPVNPSIAIVRAPDLLNQQQIGSLESRHATCTKRIEALHNAEHFGRVIGDVSPKISSFLGKETSPVLDLSALGYEFGGAGECAAPGARAVHLVYRTKDAPESNEAISLWVRADAERSIKVQAGKLYEVPRTDDFGSIVMWRRNDVVYYLVGNVADEVKNAALALRDVDK